jgi:hypothetical protein
MKKTRDRLVKFVLFFVVTCVCGFLELFLNIPTKHVVSGNIFYAYGCDYSTLGIILVAIIFATFAAFVD